MSRQDRLLYCIDKAGKGLEIGPSYNPIAPKAAGFNVKSIDHCSREDLVKKYQHNPTVDVSKIEEVDFVWNGEPYDELVNGEKFDWIIASHVIEHTPDLIQFIRSCESILSENGVLSLAVPDKRYCFDRFRAKSSIGNIVDAHLEKRTNHSIGTAIDFRLNVVSKNGTPIWAAPDNTGTFNCIHGLADAKAASAALTKSPDEYMDFHAWVFTPSSFRLIMNDLFDLGYIGLKEKIYFGTVGLEFILSYQRGAKGIEVPRIELLEMGHSEI